MATAVSGTPASSATTILRETWRLFGALVRVLSECPNRGSHQHDHIPGSEKAVSGRVFDQGCFRGSQLSAR